MISKLCNEFGLNFNGISNGSLDYKINSILELSASRMSSAGIGSSPYEIINNISDSYVDIGSDLYNAVLSSYVVDKDDIACASGCTHCCHLNSTIQTKTKTNAVGMTLLDGVSLLEYLVRIRHTQSAQTVFENVYTVWTSLPETLDRILCPFIVDGKCSVYSARPMVCRLYFSNDASHCSEQAAIPANKRQVDTPIAKMLRPIRRELNSYAKSIVSQRLPDAVFGYFDFMTTAHTIVSAVLNYQEDMVRHLINTKQSF